MRFGSYVGRIMAAFQWCEEGSFSIWRLLRRARSCACLHQGNPITTSSLERLRQTEEQLGLEGSVKRMGKAFL